MSRRRTAHGTAAANGATLVYESPATDELRPLAPAVAEPIEKRTNGTFTPEGAKVAARRRWELAKRPDFAKTELEFVPSKAFTPFDDARRKLTFERGTELAQLTGGLSRAVWTMVRGAAWLTAFAEFWAVEAAKTGSAEAAERAGRFFRQASMENAKALDIAAHEATARRDRGHVQLPSWLQLTDGDAESGGDELSGTETGTASGEREPA